MIHNSLCLISMESLIKSAAVESWAVFRSPSHVNFERVFWKRMIPPFKEPHLSESKPQKILWWSFFSKWSKLYVDLKNAIITRENVFGFEDKCIGTYCQKICLLWQEYMWLGIIWLGNISDPIKRHDTQLAGSDINVKFAY